MNDLWRAGSLQETIYSPRCHQHTQQTFSHPNLGGALCPGRKYGGKEPRNGGPLPALGTSWHSGMLDWTHLVYKRSGSLPGSLRSKLGGHGGGGEEQCRARRAAADWRLPAPRQVRPPEPVALPAPHCVTEPGIAAYSPGASTSDHSFLASVHFFLTLLRQKGQILCGNVVEPSSYLSILLTIGCRKLGVCLASYIFNKMCLKNRGVL